MLGLCTSCWARAAGDASYASVMELLEEFGMPMPLAKAASTKAQRRAEQALEHSLSLQQ